MLEFIAYKKFKKNRDQKVKAREDEAHIKDEASRAFSRSLAPSAATSIAVQGPVLTDDDELFFERLTGESTFSDEDGKRPPLPPRGNTPDYTWESDWGSDSEEQGKGKTGPAADKADGGAPGLNTKSRFSFWVRRPTAAKGSSLEPADAAAAAITPAEEEREKSDISRVLDDLNLSARNNKTFSLSKDSQELVSKFTLVLKDLVNGVPTAGRDLQHLFEDHDGTLARNYEKLPGSMKKMVTNLPTKLTTSLAPELLAVAAESQGLRREEAATGGGVKDQAMKLLIPKNLNELVTKPSAIVGMLKAIMNALKLRWPAFIGTNVIWSVALFRESFPSLRTYCY